MRKSTTATIGALALHDALAAARNPVMLVMVASCVLLSLVFAEIVDLDWLGAGRSYAFLATTVLAIAPAFVGSVGSLYAMSEEFERGVPVTLVQAGAAPFQIAAGKLLSSFAWSFLAVAVCCLMLGFPMPLSAAVVALFVPTCLPVLFLSLGLGLLADEQMRSSSYSVPIVIVAVIPMFALLSTGFRPIACFLPMGFLAEAVCAVTGAPALLPMPAVAALFLLWLAVSIAFAVWACRKFSRRVYALVNRGAASLNM